MLNLEARKMALENDSFKLRIFFFFYGLQRAELKPQKKKAVVFYILFNTLQMSFGQSNDSLKLVYFFLNSYCIEAFVTLSLSFHL